MNWFSDGKLPFKTGTSLGNPQVLDTRKGTWFSEGTIEIWPHTCLRQLVPGQTYYILNKINLED